jgi:hypothetical protein
MTAPSNRLQENQMHPPSLHWICRSHGLAMACSRTSPDLAPSARVARSQLESYGHGCGSLPMAPRESAVVVEPAAPQYVSE